MSHAVLFGGSGFIGTHLARRLATDRGMKVTIVDLHPPATTLEGVTYVHGDVRLPIDPALDPALGPAADPALDPMADPAVREPIDLVVNLAAIHRVPGHDDHEYHDTNENGAANVTAFCEARGVETVVFTSSISVYGPSESALSETSTLTPTTAYGKSKKRAEEIHRAWQEASDRRRLVIVRPAVVFGPGENGNFTRLAGALRRGTFVYPGRRDAIKACGYVLDLVSSIEFALGLDRPFFLYNFAHPERHTTERICGAFRTAGGLHRPLGSIPEWLIMVAATVAERVPGVEARTGISRTRVRKLLESTNVVPDVLEAEGFTFGYDLEAALTDWLAQPPVGRFV